jgi:energy-coupling factor transport system permease protein
LPLVQDELDLLREAVAARAHPHAEARNPLKGLPIVVKTLPPLAIGTLRRSIDIALAMELRGYRSRSPRTYVRRLQFKAVDAVALVAVALFLAGSWTLRDLAG